MFDREFVLAHRLIDTHAHRFHPDRSGDFSVVAGGYIAGEGQIENASNTILYNMMIEALRRKFEMPEEASAFAIRKERDRRYAEDPLAYSRFLFSGEFADMYCLEIGSPLGGPAYSDSEKRWFNSIIPIERTCSIVRIDRVVDELLKDESEFYRLRQRFHERLRDWICSEPCVGIKSCSAYYGGLSVENPSASDAMKAFDEFKHHPESRYARKIINDFMLYESTEEATEFSLPIQIHTGAGGGSFLDFRTQNPVNLIDFLKDDRVKNRVRIVLLHGGHPYEEETGYLVSQFANVYTDISGTFYLDSCKGPERVLALMEKAPLNKIMYGSDGVGIPEITWFAQKYVRQLLIKVFDYLTREEYLTERAARRYVSGIMYDNALECYSGIENYMKKGEKNK